jgi:hypothetical protein
VIGEIIKTAIWVLLIVGTAIGLLRIYGHITDAAEKAAQQKAIVQCFDQVVATAPDEDHLKLGWATCIMENPEPTDPRLKLCLAKCSIQSAAAHP